MVYRFIATFEADGDNCFTSEVQEKLKKRLVEDIELQCGDNVKITLEDEYCIQRNESAGLENKVLTTVDTIKMPEGKNKYFSYAKLLINNLKQIQESGVILGSDYDEALISAVNVLMEKGNEEENNIMAEKSKEVFEEKDIESE